MRGESCDCDRVPGGVTSKRSVARRGSGCSSRSRARASAATATTAAASPTTPSARGSCAARRPAPARPPASRPRRSTRSCSFTSCAVCQRSSGSFARHVAHQPVERRRRQRRNLDDRRAARRSRIDAIRLAWLLPSNARCAGRHLVEHGSRARRCRCARRPRRPRAARAPCTGTCRRSCPRAVSGCADRGRCVSDRRRAGARALGGPIALAPGRSRAAWRPPSSA